MAVKQPREALAAYDNVLRINPTHAEAFNNRSVALLALGHSQKALDSCDRALAVRSDHAEALKNRAAALYELRRFDEAVARLRRKARRAWDSGAV